MRDGGGGEEVEEGGGGTHRTDRRPSADGVEV